MQEPNISSFPKNASNQVQLLTYNPGSEHAVILAASLTAFPKAQFGPLAEYLAKELDATVYVKSLPEHTIDGISAEPFSQNLDARLTRTLARTLKSKHQTLDGVGHALSSTALVQTSNFFDHLILANPILSPQKIGLPGFSHLEKMTQSKYGRAALKNLGPSALKAFNAWVSLTSPDAKNYTRRLAKHDGKKNLGAWHIYDILESLDALFSHPEDYNLEDIHPSCPTTVLYGSKDKVSGVNNSFLLNEHMNWLSNIEQANTYIVLGAGLQLEYKPIRTDQAFNANHEPKNHRINNPITFAEKKCAVDRDTRHILCKDQKVPYILPSEVSKTIADTLRF